MTRVNYSLWSVFFLLLTGDILALEADIQFVDKIVQIQGSSKEETPDQYQFCGRSNEEELSRTCQEQLRNPKLADIGGFEFYRRQAPGPPQTYNFKRPQEDEACCTPKCCSEYCKVICAPCICIVYTVAIVDYALGRSICGEDYAKEPWSCCVDESQ